MVSFSDFTGVNSDSTYDREVRVPTKIKENGLLAPDSEAYRCFVTQGFSLKLQAYLINYNIAVESFYPIYK